MTSAEFAYKIWYVETAGRMTLHDWGDGDRAVGQFQAHIDWVFSVSRLLGLEPLVDEKYNDFVGRLVMGFFTYYIVRSFTPVQIAMHFHVGHVVYEGASSWNVKYAQDFEAAPSA